MTTRFELHCHEIYDYVAVQTVTDEGLWQVSLFSADISMLSAYCDWPHTTESRYDNVMLHNSCLDCCIEMEDQSNENRWCSTNYGTFGNDEQEIKHKRHCVYSGLDLDW